MWIAERERPRGPTEAMVGAVTVTGERAGAYLDGERRELPVFGPGGYHWRPELGQEVLVLKGAGEPSCIAGARCGGGLEPGEVCIRAGTGGAEILLRPDGTIALTGKVTINGTRLETGGG